MPPIVTRPVLKSYFPKGGKPTSAQFGSLIDSVFNFAEDTGLLGLNNYDPALAYKTGDTVVQNKIIYQANQDINPEPFTQSHWNFIAGGTAGSLLFKGTWDAENDNPPLASPQPIPPAGEFYVVNVAGDTPLSGITDWEVGDWAVSTGNEWLKIDNSSTINGAQNVGTGEGVYKNQTGSILNFRTITNLDGSVEITPDTDTINLAVEFDDAGTSLTRSWTAFKISSELATKEPTINGTGDTGDYYSGTKTFQSLSTGVLGTLLTGLSLATNQVISATDTIVQAFGYLQKQITDLLSTVTSHIGNTSNPHNVTKAQVGLSEVPNLKQNLTSNNNPTNSDDNTLGYAVGSVWINVAARKSFICLNSGTGVATWIETTNLPQPVFGNNYTVAESPGESSTLLTTFQTKVTLITGALNGTYRLQWSCATRNDKKRGEIQLFNATTGLAIGSTLSWESGSLSERITLGGSSNIVLSGTSQDISIRYRALDTPVSFTQYISDARIEFFRTS